MIVHPFKITNMTSGFKVFIQRIITVALLGAMGMLYLYIPIDGFSWVSDIVGYFYLYNTFVLVLGYLKEFPIVNKIWKTAFFPLHVIVKLMKHEAAKRVLTATMVIVFYLLFLLLVLLLGRIPIILNSRWLMVFFYVALFGGSLFITTPCFENIFNKIRVEPMAEYSAQLGKFLIHLMYLVLLATGTIVYYLYDDTPYAVCFLKEVILPAFVTYLALERVINSRKSIKRI